MNDIEQLQGIRSRTLAQIAELSESPKPSYTVDGQSVEWSEYLRQLRETVQWCDRLLAEREDPFEFHTVAET